MGLYSNYISSWKHAYIILTPLKKHLSTVKLGFTRVYIIFLISAQKHRLWVPVWTASPRRFKRVPTIYVLNRTKKNIRVFYLKSFSFWRWNFLYIWIGVCCGKFELNSKPYYETKNGVRTKRASFQASKTDLTSSNFSIDRSKAVPLLKVRVRWFYMWRCFCHYVIMFHNYSIMKKTPIQIYKKISPPKTENFQIKKNSDIFHISAQIIAYEYPQPMFLSRNKKKNVYPVNPSFTIQKWGLRGSNYRGMFSWCFFRYLGKVMLRDCDSSWVNLLIIVHLSSGHFLLSVKLGLWSVSVLRFVNI